MRKFTIVALRDSVVAAPARGSVRLAAGYQNPLQSLPLHQLNERVAQFIAAEYDRLLDPDARVARCPAELFNPLLYPGMGTY